MFGNEVIITISRNKFLDTYFKPTPIGQNVTVTPLAILYLERRILNEHRSGAPTLLRIRDVATQLCRETVDGRDENDYIELLAPLVLDACKGRLDEIFAADGVVSTRGGILSASDLDADVYIAALYTQTWPVVTRWMSSNKELAKRSLIFGVAHHHAARYGSKEILAAMMASRYEDTFQNLRALFFLIAAKVGRAETTRFLFDFQTAQRPWVFARKMSRPSYPACNEGRLAELHTPSREAFDFIMEKRRVHCTSRTFGREENTVFLVRCAQNGWVEMATHYLTLGASVNGLNCSTDNEEQRPLLTACKYGHEEATKVLLAHGADTSQPALETAVRHGQFTVISLLLDHGAEMGNALAVAVSKGYRTVVQALLKHANPIKSGVQDLIVRAVEVEDEVLFSLLVEYAGGTIYAATRAACIQVAREQGLESMLRPTQL